MNSPVTIKYTGSKDKIRKHFFFERGLCSPNRFIDSSIIQGRQLPEIEQHDDAQHNPVITKYLKVILFGYSPSGI